MRVAVLPLSVRHPPVTLLFQHLIADFSQSGITRLHRHRHAPLPKELHIQGFAARNGGNVQQRRPRNRRLRGRKSTRFGKHHITGFHIVRHPVRMHQDVYHILIRRILAFQLLIQGGIVAAYDDELLVRTGIMSF